MKNLLLCLCLLGTFPILARGKDGRKSVEQRASYLVPVAPNLAAFSLFTNIQVEIHKDKSGTIKFEYRLPLELTGVENKIEFVGTPDANGRMIAYGRNGQAKCDAKVMLTKCELTYKDIMFDQNAREEILLALADGDTEEFKARTLVSAHFEELVKNSPAPMVIMGIELMSVQNFNFEIGSEPHGILQLAY